MQILVAESRFFSQSAIEKLRTAGDVVLADADRQELLRRVEGAAVLWVRLRHCIDLQVMAAAPKLKVIVTPTTGLDHIDLAEAGRRGIAVLSLRNEGELLKQVHATAEHTIALILALLRRVPAAVEHVRQGGWNRDLFRGSELYGKTAGIVGYGRLGRMVARYLLAFGTRVLAADPHVQADAVETGVALVPLTELLGEADLVSLHVAMSDSARGFFGSHEFNQMKPGAWFVNTARGGLVNEDALLDALTSGRLAGAALDVLCDEYQESMGRHPLMEYARLHQNLIITPHIGGCTAESMEKTEEYLADQLLSILACLWGTDAGERQTAGVGNPGRLEQLLAGANVRD